MRAGYAALRPKRSFSIRCLIRGQTVSKLVYLRFLIAAVGGILPISTASAQGVANRWPLKPCKLPGIQEELQCGKLTVFENRATRSGRTIDLNVIVLPALDQDHKREPLFDLAGGPGMASTSSARLYATALKEYRRHRDVVLVDQRGTGASNPLNCSHTTDPQYFLNEMLPVDYVRDCRRELEHRADLTQYTTPVAADDLDDVRARLGYERINLFGLSYGTRAALVYMRQHPERVRSAVLMGVTPTDHKMPLYHARDGQRAMNLLLEECAADQACDNAFPNIKKELNELLVRLGREPAQAKYILPESGKEVSVTIAGPVFAEKLRSALYTPPGARKLPLIVHRAAQGDFSPFFKMVIPVERSRPDSIAEGMYLSVTCNEDTRYIDATAAAEMNRGNILGDYRVEQQVRACSLWPKARLASDYSKPVFSRVPVLILSGYMDPITPPVWGEEVASHLPNSRHVIIRHHAHVPFGLSHIECMDKIILEFIDKGDPKSINASCVDEMLPPPFSTDEVANPKSKQ